MMNELLDAARPLVALVGRNGEGKSYTLRWIQEKLPNSSIYISEEGMSKADRQIKYVKIDYATRKYIFDDESSKGRQGKVESWEISDNSYRVVSFCNDLYSQLDSIVSKSQGQKKLLNIANIFLTHNLENIEFVLLDEPENFLDEEYLKLVTKLIKLLLSNNFKIRIATHNSRLLSLLQIGVDDIVVLNNHKHYNISEETIKMRFQEIYEATEEDRKKNKFTEDASIKYKLGIYHNDVVFKDFIQKSIQSIDFYRGLFFKHVILIEGASDAEALNSIIPYLDSTVFVFTTHGKAWMPIFATVFLALGKDITIIIDSDEKQQSHATALTSVLKTMHEKNTNANLVLHNPDMENHYGIDVRLVGNALGMTNGVQERNRGWLKELAAFCFFQHEDNRKKLIMHLFAQRADGINYEFQ